MEAVRQCSSSEAFSSNFYSFFFSSSQNENLQKMQNLFSRKILRKEIVLRKEAVIRILTIRSTNSKVAFEMYSHHMEIKV